MEDKKIAGSVEIVPVKDGRKNGVLIRWKSTTLSKKEENGMISCYIPAFDIYFSAVDEEAYKNKTYALCRMFFDNYMMHNKNGLKKLTLELHKLGYKANNDVDTVHKLINNNVVKANFKKQVNERPLQFQNAEETLQESEMSIAI